MKIKYQELKILERLVNEEYKSIVSNCNYMDMERELENYKSLVNDLRKKLYNLNIETEIAINFSDR
jgi:hypothetical protein